jgi:5-formyltetrahydrofolate cyclo-ligase
VTFPLIESKAALRRGLQDRRRALPAAERPDAAIAAASHALSAPELAKARVVAAFRGIRDEIDTAPLIASLLESGRMVVLPRIVGRGQPLAFHLWRPGDDLEEAAMGVLQPHASSPSLFPDLVIAPLLGFDARGWRLGYGGGFYDRTLRLLRRDRPTAAIGFAFELQRLDEVPIGPFDERLDRVATEAALHDCRGDH